FFLYNPDMYDRQAELLHNLNDVQFPTLCFVREVREMLDMFFESDIYIRLTTAFDAPMTDEEFRAVCLSELENFCTFHFNLLKNRPPQELALLKDKCQDLYVLQTEFIKGLPHGIKDYRKALIEAIINTPFHRNVLPVGEL